MPERSAAMQVDARAAAAYFDEYYVSLTEAATRGTACTQQVRLLTQSLAVGKQAALLDLCCGHGRHLQELVQQGYSNLMGVDISAYSIDLARQRLPETVALRCANVLTSPPEGVLFEGIYCLESSWNCFTLPETRQLLQTLKSLLISQGRLVLHVFNPAYVMHRLPASLLTTTPHMQTAESRHFDVPGRLLTIHQTHTVSRPDGVVSRKQKAISLVLYTAQLLTDLLREQGFTIQQVVGDFGGGAFEETTSPDIIFVCSVN